MRSPRQVGLAVPRSRRGLRAHRPGALPRHHVPREAAHRSDDGRDEESAVAKVIRQAFACRDLADCGDECGNLPFRYPRAPPAPSDGGFDPPSRGLLCGVAVVCGFLISSRKRSVCGWSSNHLPTHLVTGLPVLSFSGSWVGESRSCVQSGYGPAINRRVTSRSERVRGRQHGRSPSARDLCRTGSVANGLRAGAGGSFRDHPAVMPVSLRPSLSSAGSLPVRGPAGPS